MFVTLFTGNAESACDLAALCVFFGATFDHHFGVFGDAQKNVRTVEGVKKRPRFSLTKTVFFAFNFEAFPECNPIFGDLRQETFMAARLKPNLRMAESTLRKAGSTADAAQQNFQFFCFF